MNSDGHMASPKTGTFGTCNGVEFSGQFATLRFRSTHEVVDRSSRRWRAIFRGLEILKRFASETRVSHASF
jgi:hypothetical protein